MAQIPEDFPLYNSPEEREEQFAAFNKMKHLFDVSTDSYEQTKERILEAIDMMFDGVEDG